MKNCFLFITLAFVHFPICLNSPSHIQTAEKETYFAELKKIHESIKEGINKLTNDANDTQRNIASMGYNSNIKKSILEDSALTQRQMIKQVIYATKLPLHLKTWDCKNLTQKQIDSYNENIEKLKKQAETAKQTVSNEADCQRTDEIKSDVGLLQTYIKQLKEQGSNTCNPPKFIKCPANTIYNGSQCIKFIKFNSDLGDKTNFIGIPPPYESNQGTCPTERPFFNEKQCQSCEMPSYFNFNTHQCEVCPLQNQFFNLVNQQCEVGTQKYVTDIRSDRIYYNGEFQKVISNVSKKKKGDPSIQTCPSDRPFYDAKNDKCINCEGQQSLFNYKYNTCIQCQSHSFFNNKRHTCFQNIGINSNQNKFFISFFYWW